MFRCIVSRILWKQHDIKTHTNSKKKSTNRIVRYILFFFPIVKMIYLDGKTSIKLKLGGG